MLTLFADSFALLKRYRMEAGSQEVLALFDRAERLLISRLTIVEVSSALIRRARAVALPAASCAAALAALDQDVLISLKVVELDELVLSHAVTIARKHGLRGVDAVQLACALGASNDLPHSDFAFVSSDDELNTAAPAEGLQVENPNLHC